jgi:hypothetical protein
VDRSAHVTSIDAVHALRTALLRFEADARDGVTLLVLEVRKALDWLEHDRTRYWPEQVRKASEKMVEARNELERCQLTYGSEEAPSCYEQKKALERAKRRLRLCEEKVKVVRRWVRSVRAELNEFDGQMARINNCLDMDVPRAAAALQRMARALEKYAHTSAPPQSDVSGAAGARVSGDADDAGSQPSANDQEP